MPLRIPVAHDFICSWCWIGWFQAEQLRRQFGVEFEWLGYELYPDSIPWPEPPAIPLVTTNRPATPTRMELAYAAQGMQRPTAVRPKQMRDHAPHESVELAKEIGFAHDWVGRLYRAYWEDGAEIGSTDVLIELGRDWFTDIDGLRSAIENRRFADRIIPFNEEAHRAGVYNLPTFFIGERYAEQPYTVLRDAMEAELAKR